MGVGAVPKHKPRRHRAPVFTREVLAAIPAWVDMGASAPDIAAALGTTVGSLQVTCSRAKISLTAMPPAIAGGLEPRHWAAIQRAADRRGVAVQQLVAAIIAGVAERDLFAAVLGEDRARSGEAASCGA